MAPETRGGDPPGALSSAELGALVEELRRELAGRRLRDVAARPPRELVLVFEGRPLAGNAPDAEGPPLRILLSASPRAARLHRVTSRMRSHRGPIGPFFQRLLDELVGARLAAVEHPPGERWCALRFEGEEARSLVLELFPRHANLILLGKGDAIRAVLHEPKAGSAAAERLKSQGTWRAPAGRGGEEAGKTAERAPFAGWPEPREAPARVSTEGWEASWRVESILGRWAEEDRRSSLIADLLKRLDRRLGQARGTVRGLEQRAAEAERAERVRQDGELLQAARGQLKRGMRTIELDDWFEEGTPRRTVELDPKLSPAANVERYFKRYKKRKRSLERLPEEQGRAEAHVQALEELRARALESDADPEAIEEEAESRRLLPARQAPPRRRAKPTARLPYRSFSSQRGTEIRVGRSARDNDRLSFHEARGNDLWLHTSDAPGSHVVLRLGKGIEPDPEDVLDAAHLAVHFSPLEKASRADVHVAHCKLLRKPKGAPAGLVTLAGGKTLHVRMEPKRLARLLDTRPARDA